jgi:hypothetical protein
VACLGGRLQTGFRLQPVFGFNRFPIRLQPISGLFFTKVTLNFGGNQVLRSILQTLFFQVRKRPDSPRLGLSDGHRLQPGRLPIGNRTGYRFKPDTA